MANKYKYQQRRENIKPKNTDSIIKELQKIKKNFDNNIESINEKFTIYKQLQNLDAKFDKIYILKSQIIFLESSLDFFLHELLEFGYARMFDGDWKKTNGYEKTNIPMREYHRIATNNSSEKNDAFSKYIHKIFSGKSFLNTKNMKYKLDSIGIPYQDVMHHVFKKNNKESSEEIGTKKLNTLYAIRNEIAHHNCMNHSFKKQKKIDKKYVKQSIRTIKMIVDAIVEIAYKKMDSGNK